MRAVGELVTRSAGGRVLPEPPPYGPIMLEERVAWQGQQWWPLRTLSLEQIEHALM
jgi:hypothetical protein